MKKIIILLLFPLLCNISYSQNKVEADKLVDEGVILHDKGDYKAAISLYDKALELDKDNLMALTEKAYTLLYLERYEEVISYCQRAFDAHPGDKKLGNIYVTCGNAYDGMNKTDKALDMYDKGIKQFPDFFMLHFNKGITLTGLKKYNEAIRCFQQSAKLNPGHASSHNAIARLTEMNSQRIPALLAYCRFLSIEPKGTRALENLASLQRVMKGNVQKTGDNSVTINMSPEMLGNSKKKPDENSFTSTDLILTMDAGLDFDKKNADKTEVERFIRKMETLCSSLNETKKRNYGFYWEYYVPYFIAMKDKKFIEAFSYIAFASSGDPEVSKWLESHKTETDSFFEWSKSFEWKAD